MVSRENATYIATTLNLSGDYWVSIIRALIALSTSSRIMLKEFITAQIVTIRIQIRTYSTMTTRADYLSENISKMHGIITEVLAPVQVALNTSPIDAVFFTSPELEIIYKNIIDFVPLKIPASVVDFINDKIGADFFDGITKFSDLRDKLDELQFRAARASSLREYADKGVSFLNTQIDKLQKIVDILTVLDI